MADLKLAVLLGTTRKNNKSQHMANFVFKKARESGYFSEVVLVDPKDLNLPDDGNDQYAKDPKYSKITEEADAFFIVTPEYNHSFPGTLKRLLDSELKNYVHKAVAVAGVSSGRFGGVRATEALTSPLRKIGMVMTFSDVQVSNVGDAFDEKGEPQQDYINDSVKNALIELKWMAQTLKWGRENLDSKYH